jgi:unsaturated chondroitin disaccharide hydrolase
MIEPNEPRLAKLAQDVSSWWVAHAPADRVAYWDFSAPVTPDTWRDTSGTAIAAAALIRIAGVTGEAHYAATAEDTVRAVVKRHLTPIGGGDDRPAGILADGCFDVRHGVALSNELIWGDYFLFEALGHLSGRLGAARI